MSLGRYPESLNHIGAIYHAEKGLQTNVGMEDYRGILQKAVPQTLLVQVSCS